MSAEPKPVTSPESWTQWEQQVVNDDFPLRRLLGCSDHSAVFLTEHRAKKLADAAIKIVRADAPRAKAQRDQWRAAATLSHPNLVQLLDVGRCWAGGREYFFVVMEYADQTLAQILRQRALTSQEVRELLPPTLNALVYLHRKQLVHGRLKPSNFLAVNDQLKLSSDTIRPAGLATSGIVTTTAYDPPELQDRGISTAGDVWSLGMTLVEALTQHTPSWPDQESETATLPDSLPTPFVGLLRRCLSRSPAQRPTVVELEAPYKSAQ